MSQYSDFFGVSSGGGAVWPINSALIFLVSDTSDNPTGFNADTGVYTTPSYGTWIKTGNTIPGGDVLYPTATNRTTDGIRANGYPGAMAHNAGFTGASSWIVASYNPSTQMTEYTFTLVPYTTGWSINVNAQVPNGTGDIYGVATDNDNGIVWMHGRNNTPAPNFRSGIWSFDYDTQTNIGGRFATTVNADGHGIDFLASQKLVKLDQDRSTAVATFRMYDASAGDGSDPSFVNSFTAPPNYAPGGDFYTDKDTTIYIESGSSAIYFGYDSTGTTTGTTQDLSFVSPSKGTYISTDYVGKAPKLAFPWAGPGYPVPYYQEEVLYKAVGSPSATTDGGGNYFIRIE